jgi:hypothetical protein
MTVNLSTIQVCCAQDRTGSVAQVTLTDTPANPVAVGDTGTISGTQSWNGKTVSYAFSVGQLVDNGHGDFGITTETGPFSANGDGAGPGNVLLSSWPDGDVTIKWLTGANLDLPSAGFEASVDALTPANAYITPTFLAQYNLSRGQYTYPTSPIDAVMQAIVQASQYLDFYYSFKGIKLLQFLNTNPNIDALIPFIDPWLTTSWGMGEFQWFQPSATYQQTEWPRQGAQDRNGDSVYGIPLVLKRACAELALRVLAGTTLIPDFDPGIVGNGGVVASKMSEVGPIRTETTYDTKLGLGFFPDFPIVTRMLSNGGLLVANGGRKLIR